MNEPFTHAATVARIDLAHESDFTLGRLEVRPSLREIVCGGRREIIDRRVMQVLVALARADGGVVSRDDLIASCWESVVVGEDAITNCIVRLRKAAEASGRAFTVETVPRVGYRLRAAEAVSSGQPKQPDVPSNLDSSVPTTPAPLAAPAIKAPPRTRWVAAVSAIVLLALVGASVALWRYRSAKPVQAPANPVEASVAVLPFVNMSGDPKNEYFSDGFSEELRSELSNDSRLRVVARTSAFAFKGVNTDVKVIAHALRVRTIVEGTVREIGNRVRITAELINASDGFLIWSATYDRDLSDILNIQSDVAHAVAGALTRKLLPLSSMRRPKIDPRTYRQYLEARWQISLYSLDSTRMAYSILRDVTAKEPDFAEGLAALAHAERLLAGFDTAHENSYLAQSNETAARALLLNPHNVEARAEHENSELLAWNWKGAASDFATLRAEGPDNYDALRGIRAYYKLMGFPAQALAVDRRAYANFPPLIMNLVDTLEFAGLFRELIQTVRNAPVQYANRTYLLPSLCEAYAKTGQAAMAEEIRQQLTQLGIQSTNFWHGVNCEFYVDIAEGRLQAARNLAEYFESKYPDEFVNASAIAESYVELNDFEKASDWYERAYATRDGNVLVDSNWSLGASYRKTARWKALTQQPAFKEWQAEHDRIAAALAAHRDPLN